MNESKLAWIRERNQAKERKTEIPSLKTRKPVDELTLLDYETFPMWEYVYDESNYGETYVKPILATTIPEDKQVQVFAEFTTADGRVFAGRLEVWPDEGIREYRFPSVFAKSGEIDLDPSTLQINEVEKGFDQSVEKTYPIRWRLRVPHFGDASYASGVLRIGGQTA